MLAEIFLFLFLGLLAGIITGLIPGIHINLVGVFLVALSASLLSFLNPVYFVVFICAMAISHTFIDFIPSVFLGCPDTETELSILPGHELLRDGRGYEAVCLTAYGGLAAIFMLLILVYPSIFALSKVYNFIKILIPGLLLLVSFFMMSTERKIKNALIVFLLTGILGLIVLNINFKEPLLPLLTGLFGSSMLLISIKDKIKIPKQKITEPEEKFSKKSLIAAFIASPLCGFLPGLGSGQAAIIGNSISKTTREGFLVLLGATNTFVMGLSFIALYAISKTRTGASVAVKELIGTLSPQILILILSVILISGVSSFFITKKVAKFLAQKIGKINYTKLSWGTLSFLAVIVFLVSGFFGLLVLAVSTFTGIYCISLGVKRTNMMGCLLLPTILIYLV